MFHRLLNISVSDLKDLTVKNKILDIFLVDQTLFPEEMVSRLTMKLCVCVCMCRPVFEGCFSEEPLPYSDPTGAAGGGNCRLDSPSQESRLQTQRIRGQDSRGHGHTPQNRPHGHQPPDLPEGYGPSNTSRTNSGYLSGQNLSCRLYKLV